MTDPPFRADLYRGTAESYDTYRPPYPPELIDNLTTRIGADGTGRMLDLACGTGQVAFAVRDRFAEVWAADQEPSMIAVAIRKAAGDAGFIFRTGPAEDLDLPLGAFDLVTIGNAFHRLPRDVVAGNVRRWLRPGGHIALLWGHGPAVGDEPWQQALRDVVHRWQDRNGADQRIPAGYDTARRARPDRAVLTAAGFDAIADIEVSARHAWTLDQIAGYLASTSVLSAAALGDDVEDFDGDLRDALRSSQADEPYWQATTFRCELARASAPESTQ